MFECKTCGKLFKSKQSLGGHASSHNRGESFKVGRKKDRSKKNYLCKYCEKQFDNGLKLGGHQVHCNDNPNKQETRRKIGESNRGKKHTEECKKRLSASRTKYLAENPDKHPWKNNSKFKSIPCETLKEILRNNGFKFEEEYNPISKRFFSTDIAFPVCKICIEVNGEHHYNRNGMLKKYYRDRHNLIAKNGWEIIEIHYLKIYNTEYIDNLIKRLRSSVGLEQLPSKQ